MSLRSLNFRGSRGVEGSSSAAPVVDVKKLLQPTSPVDASSIMTGRSVRNVAVLGAIAGGLSFAAAFGADTDSPLDRAADRPQYGIFHPAQAWKIDKLRNEPATTDNAVLAAHGLTRNDVKEYRPQIRTWEPGIHAY